MPRGPLAVGTAVACALAVLAVTGTATNPFAERRPPAYVVYGGEVTKLNGRVVTCTREAILPLTRTWSCVSWESLAPGQVAIRAKPAAGECALRHVDQRTGAWICDLRERPAPRTDPPATA